jgi:hypothetical protein
MKQHVDGHRPTNYNLMKSKFDGRFVQAVMEPLVLDSRQPLEKTLCVSHCVNESAGLHQRTHRTTKLYADGKGDRHQEKQ